MQLQQLEVFKFRAHAIKLQMLPVAKMPPKLALVLSSYSIFAIKNYAACRKKNITNKELGKCQ